MFNWNWAGLIPLSLALVQMWSDAILKPGLDKKEADLALEDWCIQACPVRKDSVHLATEKDVSRF